MNREGLYHLNMKKLAKEAGLAIGTAYIYFDSKETIINELYQKIVRESEVVVFKNFQSEPPFKGNDHRDDEKPCYIFCLQPRLFQLPRTIWFLTYTAERKQRTIVRYY
ncbi:TetR/AcrR family transcriptional regulator [Xanthocytophaga agilis]|uniref:TetR/AcrR family transcriptional regulator n=1 Tax=Xanthocytophaga agilis TaxID=3048010 RepID=UPI003B00912B